MERRLDWASCVNVRDLGGHPTPGGTTRWHSIVRADNLNRLTAAGRAALVAYGVRTVIDLRDPREIEKFPYPFAAEDLSGVHVVNAPLISKANWDALPTNDTEDPYVMIARLSAENIVAALRAVNDAPPSTVVIHCHEGRERTGVVAAVLLALAGVSDDLIAEDWVASLPDSMRGAHIRSVLEFMRERNGSVEEFLVSWGLARSDLDELRARLA